jgi:2-oxoglutarate ferredoxin oxidoreductase subunit gamma
LNIKANDIALKMGNAKAMNMIILGALVGASGIVSFEGLKETLGQKLGKKKDLLEINYNAIEEGYNLGIKVKQEKTKA